MVTGARNLNVTVPDALLPCLCYPLAHPRPRDEVCGCSSPAVYLLLGCDGQFNYAAASSRSYCIAPLEHLGSSWPTILNFSQRRSWRTLQSRSGAQFFVQHMRIFVAGITSALVTGRETYSEGSDLAGFWIAFGHEIPLVQKVGV